MKEIIPVKLIIDLNVDGTFKDGIIQYQIKNDGAMDSRKFYTVGIKNGMDVNKFIDILIDTQTIALNAEGIDLETAQVLTTLSEQKVEAEKIIIKKEL
jgi:hypothetical protein